jgi:hypothetical protein
MDSLMFLHKDLATTISENPSVGQSRPEELQGLLCQTNLNSMDDVYTIYKTRGYCDVDARKLKMTNIRVLCNYRGINTIISGPQPHSVPVANHNYDIRAILLFNYINDRFIVRGIRILNMKSLSKLGAHL